MIAKAAVAPIVVPFYHQGMEEALPLHEETGAMLRSTPKLGVDISVSFGDPIAVDDLLQAFVLQHGRDELNAPWGCEEEESEHVLHLYALITARIQEKMGELDGRKEWEVREGAEFLQ